ncbi:MAG: sulfatase-like hydrolase/transferase [Planctomycetaceae bacterium]|nr:sulfatase-like hydrolase/transferase [Planctomycetaceae bacterium]
MSHRLLLTTLLTLVGFCSPLTESLSRAADRPNILWITSEDNGPHLGCYGDEYATTPNLDAFAETGLRYLTCWSNAPVCAPARTCLISGLYPPSTGAEHMRSQLKLPDGFLMYPQYLREAGYYCTNNSKEDYNLEKPGQVWDDSSNTAHWKNRAEGQPFFAIFNHTISHESQIRNAIPRKNRIHDPKQVSIPAYHPDRPEVRQDWAQYYDRVTMMDAQFGETLGELEDAGLAEDTIVFYYGDHGSGMPRNKRWPYNSGLHVPLLIRIPEKFAHLRPADYQTGGTTDRLVGFIDMAPTLLSLAGIAIPEHFQGHAFAGEQIAEPQPYLYGFRGRMDERYDLVRSLRDQQYVYIRNYNPHEIYGQFLEYMFQTPTTRIWKQMYDLGQLNEAQSHFWQQKPPEELYDLNADPDEVNNLAGSEAHQETLARLREANREHLLAIRDVGFIPEIHLHTIPDGLTPYEFSRRENEYPVERILETAELASSLAPEATSELVDDLSHPNVVVRYWAALGLLMRGEEAVSVAHEPLVDALEDPSEAVKIVAAEALARYSDEPDDQVQTLTILITRANMQRFGLYTSMAALNALDDLDHKVDPQLQQLKNLPRESSDVPPRLEKYVSRLLDRILTELED